MQVLCVQPRYVNFDQTSFWSLAKAMLLTLENQLEDEEVQVYE